VRGLKERGFESPYLRAFVVARINPLRFKRGATAEFDETIDKMLAAARRFDPAKIRADQVARASGPPEEAPAS
jgi:ParB family transcriptional regulator, chromosome partitioning protein